MEQVDIDLKEAITLILEPAEFFIKDAKDGTIGKRSRLKSAVSCLKEFIENGFPVGQNSQELELLTKRVDTLTGITEIFGPILERLETLEAKMSKIEKEKL